VDQVFCSHAIKYQLTHQVFLQTPQSDHSSTRPRGINKGTRMLLVGLTYREVRVEWRHIFEINGGNNEFLCIPI
jgi:hypothetical protein